MILVKFLSSVANDVCAQLSNKRRVNVTKFNKALLINIREYYEAAGELKPGKKVRSSPHRWWLTLSIAVLY